MSQDDGIEGLLASGLIDASMGVGLLANHTAYSFRSGEYLFRILTERCRLLRVFVPEHGLFAELQDQVALADPNPYGPLARAGHTEWVSLYGEHEGTLRPDVSLLADLDAVIIDVQDVGARYYTFLTSAWYAIESAARAGLKLTSVVLDRPNPAGRTVEGTPLQASFASFVGVPGVLHRHGLTAGELLGFYAERLRQDEGIETSLTVIPFGRSAAPTWEICPSPNMPSPITPLVYAGQCLLEGTNVSEGRGTTRPFEIFGAPWIDLSRPLPDHLTRQRMPQKGSERKALLRPLRFLPMFHKYAGSICHGWQIHLPPDGFHSLLFSLDLIRYLKEEYAEFAWRTEAYEYRSDLLAIEMLAGDLPVLDYLNGRLPRDDLVERFRQAEEAWIKRLAPHLIYQEGLHSGMEALETV